MKRYSRLARVLFFSFLYMLATSTEAWAIGSAAGASGSRSGSSGSSTGGRSGGVGSAAGSSRGGSSGSSSGGKSGSSSSGSKSGSSGSSSGSKSGSTGSGATDSRGTGASYGGRSGSGRSGGIGSAAASSRSNTSSSTGRSGGAGSAAGSASRAGSFSGGTSGSKSNGNTNTSSNSSTGRTGGAGSAAGSSSRADSFSNGSSKVSQRAVDAGIYIGTSTEIAAKKAAERYADFKDSLEVQAYVASITKVSPLSSAYKQITVQGIPVYGLTTIPNKSFATAYTTISHMLANNPDMVKALVKAGVNLNLTNSANLQARIGYSGPVAGYAVVATGYTVASIKGVSPAELTRIVSHELGHQIDTKYLSNIPGVKELEERMHKNAQSNPAYNGTYAASTPKEYIAEAFSAYATGKNLSMTYGQLKNIDREVADFVANVLGSRPRDVGNH